ncbi:hypothetical protein G7Y89_g3458 [Cudoniella acicularis]|uniref:Uncharacterized protein n=1 Tax=Cudoniella acicularis TaxID=354080 RepID=A0A8H4RSL6_9HELO|nr:hypothetical protein G7Y89_g3458 [Cudoniella acicularis]
MFECAQKRDYIEITIENYKLLKATLETMGNDNKEKMPKLAEVNRRLAILLTLEPLVQAHINGYQQKIVRKGVGSYVEVERQENKDAGESNQLHACDILQPVSYPEPMAQSFDLKDPYGLQKRYPFAQPKYYTSPYKGKQTVPFPCFSFFRN